MPFKLLKLVLLANFVVWLPKLSFPIFAAEDGVFSLKGQVPGLVGISVFNPVLRSDGRYLFFSSSQSWNVIDMLDMVRKASSEISVKGTIQAMSLLSDTRLMVVTNEGIQYFDVTEVFDPEEEDTDYELPDLSGTGRSVSGACVNTSGLVFFLEVGSSRDSHRLRVVQNKSEIRFVEWASLMGGSSNDIDPILSNGILCAKDALILLGEYRSGSAPSNHEEDLLISRIPYESLGATAQVVSLQDQVEPVISGFQNFSSYDEFVLSELGFDADKQNIFVSFNAASADQTIENSANAFVHRISAAALDSTSTIRIGEGLKAVAKYKLKETSYLSFFLEKHFFDSPDLDGENELLNIKQEDFKASVTGEEFGLPGDSVFPPSEISSTAQNLGIGNEIFSEWLFSESDHYVYGKTGSSGLVLLSKAPALYFVTNPGIPTLSGSSPLEFGLATDENLDYEIRLIEETDSKGDATGLDLTKGKLIDSGRLTENTTTAFSLSTADVGATKDGELSLLIIGQPRDDSGTTRIARTGLRFKYDPPPEPVKNLRLKTGSQSLHIYFDPTTDPGDLSEYQIYFSYDQNDLDNLPASDAELASYSRTLTLQNGELLTSPIRVSKDRFRGKYVIAPIENDRELFVRVQIVDTARQYSTNNPAALGKSPKATQRLDALLGGRINGCSLHLRP